MDKSKLKLIMARKNRELTDETPYFSEESLSRMMGNMNIHEEDKQTLFERGHSKSNVNAMNKVVVKEGLYKLFNDFKWNQQPPKGGFDA